MIKLQKSTFYNESETKIKLCEFITGATILSMGEQCRQFEKAFAKKQKRTHAVFVNSGSSANLLLIQAFLNSGRLKKGDIVGVSALTWATNIMPLIQLGLQPFLVDCEIDSLNVSSRTFRDALDVQPNMKAFFLTNTLGLCDDIVKIAQLCTDEHIVFFEDNCEALGSVIDRTLLGNFGVGATFSFFVGHHLSTIEGGMICTDDDELHAHLLMARSHGWDRNLGPDHQKVLRTQHGIDEFYSKYTFYDLAYNVRPSEINGFLGCVQINYWDEIVQRRFSNFSHIHKAIAANEDIVSIRFEQMDLFSSFAIPVICTKSDIFLQYKEKFTRAEVEIRPMIAGNMARQPFYRKYIGNPGSQPNAEFIHKNSFYFGNHPELTSEEVDLVCNLLAS
ncbi:MAG: DegT/DnrJ/EryC1/StrS aminotransferase family protein [Polaromonas sp.]|nr:DegT/DnrJ/EryC1/StrS aminotransferase family protein [Polaromonas sp.]MDP3751408.1 DegT/DnrJ/EryC1/StrS aminotransferase family protein [Polaromonas sp.]